MITDIEDYFVKGCGRCARFATPVCSVMLWAAGLADLRRICLAAGLLETVKWGHPCYMIEGRNIALIGAFREDFRLTFFNAALMKDPEGVLERQGPNTRHASMLRFTDTGQPVKIEPLILSYLDEAMGYAHAGITAPKEPVEVELPDELAEALDTDPELAEAFHSLTGGRKRSYVIALNAAKTSATRMARISKYRDRILAGQGSNER